MKYILEHEEESRRLKLQEVISVYNLRNDMDDFNIKPEDIVLDAGCGAGVISLYLKKNYRFKQLYSCDFSELRLKQAEKYLIENGVVDTKLFQCDLNSIPHPDHTFTKIICRFVFEYLADPVQVAREFHRIVSSEGEVRIIDLDGVVANLHSRNEKLNKMLEKLTKCSYEKYHLDFFAGRKLYTHMKQVGFKDLQLQVRPMHFKGVDLLHERNNYVERFLFAKNILDDTFGDESEDFVEMYLAELENPETTLFYNNFVITGKK